MAKLGGRQTNEPIHDLVRPAGRPTSGLERQKMVLKPRADGFVCVAFRKSIGKKPLKLVI